MIAYIVLGDITSGVKNKLHSKICSMNELGMEVVLFHFCSLPPHHSDYYIIVNVRSKLANLVSKVFILWRLGVILYRWKAFSLIKSEMRKFKPEKIIFRYPLGDYSLFSFMKKFKQNVVFEHNTIEVNELTILAPHSWWYKYLLFGEKKFGKPIRSLAAGLISVTHEIDRYETKELKVLSTVIANGIDVNKVPLRSLPAWDGEKVYFLFLSGSAAAWHGLDIIISSIAKYTSLPHIHFIIAGGVSESTQREIRNFRGENTIEYLPNQGGDDLARLFNRCHVGIGSMGHFLTGMQEACPLKTREYWARGLPFVIGYEDTDLVDVPEMNSFYIKTSGKFPVDEIVLFAERMAMQSDHPYHMRLLAEKFIDMKFKAKLYANFMNSLRSING